MLIQIFGRQNFLGMLEKLLLKIIIDYLLIKFVNFLILVLFHTHKKKKKKA